VVNLYIVYRTLYVYLFIETNKMIVIYENKFSYDYYESSTEFIFKYKYYTIDNLKINIIKKNFNES